MRTGAWWILSGIALVVTALVLAVGGPGTAAPARITPGVGIGPLTLGMRAADVQRVMRKTITPKLSGNRVVYDFPSHGLTAYATDNYVVRVRTRNVLHKTPGGIHPGLDWSDGFLSTCGGMAMTSSIPGGEEISCPFAGISFEVKNGEISGVAVTIIPTRR